MIVPFRWKRSPTSNAKSVAPLSVRYAWLRLVNKLQILALLAPAVGPQLERIVDAVLEELQR